MINYGNLPEFELQYLDILQRSLRMGSVKPNRTGVDTSYSFAETLRADLRDCFPILSSKKVWFKGPIAEMIWMAVMGSADDSVLAHLTKGDPEAETFWTANLKAPSWQSNPHYQEVANPKYLGRIYGKQMREWKTYTGHTVDQIRNIEQALINNPFDRGIHLSVWNPGELSLMALRPCHVSATFSVSPERKLNCAMLMRSADIFLGVPFNLAFYAALTHSFAAVSALGVGQLHVTMVDCHLYETHREAATKQLEQADALINGEWIHRPKLSIPVYDTIDKYVKVEDFQLSGYIPAGAIAAPMAV